MSLALELAEQDKRLPCPHCNGRSIYYKREYIGGCHVCSDCGAEGPRVEKDNCFKSRVMWNTRSVYTQDMIDESGAEGLKYEDFF